MLPFPGASRHFDDVESLGTAHVSHDVIDVTNYTPERV